MQSLIRQYPEDNEKSPQLCGLGSGFGRCSGSCRTQDHSHLVIDKYHAISARSAPGYILYCGRPPRGQCRVVYTLELFKRHQPVQDRRSARARSDSRNESAIHPDNLRVDPSAISPDQAGNRVGYVVHLDRYTAGCARHGGCFAGFRTHAMAPGSSRIGARLAPAAAASRVFRATQPQRGELPVKLCRFGPARPPRYDDRSGWRCQHPEGLAGQAETRSRCSAPSLRGSSPAD